jgi:hypothetical protein
MSESYAMRIEDSFNRRDDHAVVVGELAEFLDQVHKSSLNGTLFRRKLYVRGSGFFHDHASDVISGLGLRCSFVDKGCKGFKFQRSPLFGRVAKIGG